MWQIPFLSFSSVIREFEVKSAALLPLKRLQFWSLSVERIPLLDMAAIFQKNVTPDPDLFERVFSVGVKTIALSNVTSSVASVTLAVGSKF